MKSLEHLAKKYSKVREGVGAIMGGKILDYPAKQALNQGRAEERSKLALKAGTLNQFEDEIVGK